MHPILIKFGSVTIYSYGFMVAVGVLLSLTCASILCRKNGLSFATASDLIFIAVLFGLVGARAFFIAQNGLSHPSGSGSLWSVWMLQEGGLVWYGGFLSAVTAGGIYAKWKKLDLWVWLDLFAAIIPLSHAGGRIGCYLNGCCGGTLTFPLQLIEAWFLLALSLFLLWRLSKPHAAGALFCDYLILYGIGRFVLEYFREQPASWGALTIPQWISLALVGSALVVRKGRVAR